jgi:XTP/dITP diphosphohydrolase
MSASKFAKIVIASTNAMKIAHIKNYSFFKSIQVLTAADVKLDEVEENGDTLEENALIKARHCYKATGLPSVGDDAGFFVTALGGWPGIHCGRFAGETGKRDFERAARIINEKLGDSTDRSATFSVVLAFVADEVEYVVRGDLPGTFVYPGALGSDPDENRGYNPYFRPENSEFTYAQAGILNESSYSHRTIAIKKLIEKLRIDA